MKGRDGQKAVGYIRVSTDEQQIGPEAQRDALRRYCATTGAVPVALHEDLGLSGGLALDKRPGLLAALASLDEHQAGVLLVAKRDRLRWNGMAREPIRVCAAPGVGVGSLRA